MRHTSRSELGALANDSCGPGVAGRAPRILLRGVAGHQPRATFEQLGCR